MYIDHSIYFFMNNQAKYLNLWISLFATYTVMRIILSVIKPKSNLVYSLLASELAGLPLTLLHSICFIKAINAFDIISALIFLWWGPGFIITASWFLYIKWKKIDFDWSPFGRITSIACKLNYLLFMLVYWYFGCWEIIMVFSTWIIHDQINLAWFANNADRTRRLTEDFWVIRLCYICGLFLPIFITDFSYRAFSVTLGVILFLLWVLALIKVIKKGHFYYKPSSKDFLRNIVYLTKK